MTTITVYKNDYLGRPVTHYQGELLDRAEQWLCLQATFKRGRVNLGVVAFEPGDRLLEWFFSDRWYNIFQLHDGESDHIKGWYCNITRPALLTEDAVEADDLELDLFVDPTGAISLIDELEFQALDLITDERMAVLQAVEELRQMVTQRVYPFHVIRL